MNPLATSFVFTKASNSVEAERAKSEPAQKPAAGVAGAGPNIANESVVNTPEVHAHRAEVSQSQMFQNQSSSGVVSSVSRDIDRTGNAEHASQTDTDELTALRAANAALTQRMHEIERETPCERSVRKLKLKSAEIEELKASVERVTAQTEATKKQLAERQAHLRDLNAQIAKLQPPVPFAIKEKRDRRKKKEKKEKKEKNVDE